MRENRARTTQVMALLSLTVFALCLLLVLLTGASLYRRFVEEGEAAYARRTALQYLTTRVRQAENVQAGELEGCASLILQETLEGETYTTYVYCYEGWLRELYTVPGAKLPPGAGEALVEAEQFALLQEERLLTVIIDGEELLLHLPERDPVGL